MTCLPDLVSVGGRIRLSAALLCSERTAGLIGSAVLVGCALAGVPGASATSSLIRQGFSREPNLTRSSAASSSVLKLNSRGARQRLLPCPNPPRFSTSSSPHLLPRVAASRGTRGCSRMPDALSLMRVNHVLMNWRRLPWVRHACLWILDPSLCTPWFRV